MSESATEPVTEVLEGIPEGDDLRFPPLEEQRVARQGGHLQTADSVLAIITKAAENPSFDPAKMEALLGLHERILAKQAEMTFNQAMARLQDKLPAIEKRGKIVIHSAVQSRYALYEDIDEAVRPLLAAEGFSIRYNTKKTETEFSVFGTLSHREGHSITAEITLPIDKSGNKNATQGIGSTLAYGKRYVITMLLNLVTTDETDDDGGKTGGVALVEEPHIKEIEDKIKSVGADRERFLEYLCVDDLKKLRLTDFPKAMNALKLKESINEQEKAAAAKAEEK